MKECGESLKKKTTCDRQSSMATGVGCGAGASFAGQIEAVVW